MNTNTWARKARCLVLAVGLSLLGSAFPGAADGATTRRTTVSKSTPKTVKKPASKNRRVSSATRSKRYSASRARARRARLARARAAQQARELRELASPLYKTGADGALVPDVRAAAAVIYNPTTQEVLWEENGDDARSIASITKVMTAIVAFAHEPDLDRQIEVVPGDVYHANHTYLRRYERVRVGDLLHLLLVASDNAAARALARASTFGPQGFIDEMNATALELGLTHTHYADPSGLDAANVSSARDMARLIAYAAGDERIAAIMRKSDYQFTTSRRSLTVHNTNQLLGSDIDVRGGKTGFIRNAGYCLATLLKLPQTDQHVAVVVLGARSSTGRFMETRHLFNWVSTKAQSLLTAVESAAEPAPEHHPD